MPRLVVGKHGESYLCPDCLRQDDHACGLAYWHREHQAPGVNVCWKHKTSLISCCPNCSFPFQRLNKLLAAPWLPCRCGYEIKTASSSDRMRHNMARQPKRLLSNVIIFGVIVAC
ncbi:TniQ family protein [Undibacterium sp. Di27W]|uniref:TniQ family protein n=1 Tax=Undibacterium sp. Di27W TaxID=3413036 RepID=UPI003BF08930